MNKPSLLARLDTMTALFGIRPLYAMRAMRGLPVYLRNRREIRRQAREGTHDFPFAHAYPCLFDRYECGGSATGHYFHQDLLVARRVFANSPRRHIDVGSRFDGLVTHIASFRAIEVIDIRPVESKIPNITFMQADMMAPLRQELHDCCDSLSCLHALEHFGLGRYGDPVRYDGHLLGLRNLYDMLEKGGRLYFSVPMGGPQRINFDAHRVFSTNYLLGQFEGKYRIEHFSYVDDRGDLHEDVPVTETDAGNNFGCRHGCGIFEMIKL